MESQAVVSMLWNMVGTGRRWRGSGKGSGRVRELPSEVGVENVGVEDVLNDEEMRWADGAGDEDEGHALGRGLGVGEGEGMMMCLPGG